MIRRLESDSSVKELLLGLCCNYQTILLEGDTASGKTAVYAEAIAAALAAGRGALALVPEIALATPLLLGIAFSASVGGVGTPIGTPPNLIFMQVYENTTGTALSFLDWMGWGGSTSLSHSQTDIDQTVSAFDQAIDLLREDGFEI